MTDLRRSYGDRGAPRVQRDVVSERVAGGRTRDRDVAAPGLAAEATRAVRADRPAQAVGATYRILDPLAPRLLAGEWRL